MEQCSRFLSTYWNTGRNVVGSNLLDVNRKTARHADDLQTIISFHPRSKVLQLPGPGSSIGHAKVWFGQELDVCRGKHDCETAIKGWVIVRAEQFVTQYVENGRTVLSFTGGLSSSLAIRLVFCEPCTCCIHFKSSPFPRCFQLLHASSHSHSHKFPYLTTN